MPDYSTVKPSYWWCLQTYKGKWMQTYGWLPADEVLALAQIRMALQGMHSQEWPCLRDMFLFIL